MGKKAVLVGCNYPGTEAELKGCVNDVKRMYSCLVQRYGFLKDEITILIDNDSSYVQATGINIMNAFSNLVSSAKAGDILFIHYSGHGRRLPADDGVITLAAKPLNGKDCVTKVKDLSRIESPKLTDGDDDKTGYDECIVPTDMNLITDDDFRNLVNKVPEGCRLTIVSDSCHSGGLIDETKEQIGDSTKKSSCFDFKSFSSCLCPHALDDMAGGVSTNKSLQLSTLVDILKQKTGNKDISIGNLRSTLFDLFGEHASPKVKKFMREEDSELAQEESGKQLPFDNGILISGCQSYQISTDFSPTGKEAYGALSNVIQAIIAETDGKVTNSELVLRARTMLKRQGFAQRPGLYCSDDNVNATFLC